MKIETNRFIQELFHEIVCKVCNCPRSVGCRSCSSRISRTLDDVKARGELKCGVSGGVPGFSAPDDAGRMQGIDAAVCDAIAAAVLGDASKVVFIPLTAKERFTALASGEVDVLSRNTTHTLTREASLGLNFTYYNYIDGQGFMVMKDSGIKSTLELDGASICVQAGTTTELNMADYFRNNNMKFTPVGYETSTQTREGFGGACDVLTSDKSQLAALSTEMKWSSGCNDSSRNDFKRATWACRPPRR